MKNNTYNPIDDMLSNFETYFKLRHPIFYWIDYRLFNKKGIFGYAPHYILIRPWLLVKNIGYQIEYAWQRVFRGWDDTVIWSIDLYLTEMLPIWLQRLKETQQGIPTQCFIPEDWDAEKYEYKDGAEERAIEKWDFILDQIIDGFNAYKFMSDNAIWKNNPEYETLNNKFQNAFNLLKENFGSFWD